VNNLFLSDIPGIWVGHAQDLDAATGCTVLLTPYGAVCGVDQRGGAPGTRETDLLRPMHLVSQVHAILLAGGSAFGLSAADGVMRWLEERGHGFDTGVARVPIVPAAVLFDLAIGRADVRPDAAMGYEACQAAIADNRGRQTGTVGAGTGATVGKILGPQAAMKGGLGQSVIEVLPGIRVGAMISVNCFGDVIDPHSGTIMAGARKLPDNVFVDTMRELPNFADRFTANTNTVIGIIATNATLDKEGANKVAQMAHNGLAQTVRPAHSMFDGDTLFAVSSGQAQAMSPTVIGAYAAEATALAVINAVQEATTLAHVPAVVDLEQE